MNMIVTAAAPETAGNVGFVRGTNTAAPVEPWTATIGVFGNALRTIGSVPKGRLVAPLYRDRVNFVGISGSDLLCEGLDYFDTRPAAFYLGSKLTVLREVNSKIVQIGETSVTGATVKYVTRVLGDKSAIAAGGTSSVWSPQGYNRPNSTIYFALATIDDAGKRSAYSRVVSYTRTAKPQNIENTQTLVDTPIGFDKLVESANLPVPQGVTLTPINGGESARINWTAQPGHKVIVAASPHADFVNDQRLTIDNPGMVQMNDLVVCSKRFDHTTQKLDSISNRSWNAGEATKPFGIGGIANFNSDLPAGVSYVNMSEGGRNFVRITVASGVSFSTVSATHHHSSQSFYEVLEPGKFYNIRVTARATGTGTTSLQMQGTNTSTRPVTFGSDWTTVEESFSVSQVMTSGAVQVSKLTMVGPLTVDLERLSIFNDGAEPFAADQSLVDMLIDSGVGLLRFHSTIKTRPWTYSMKDVLSAVGCPATGGNSVPQSLNVLKAVRDTLPTGFSRLNPWIQIEMYMSDTELAGFGEYMCTPYDPLIDTPETKPWAYLRFSQGQVQPWQDYFGNITLEGGNENWNTTDGFYTLKSMGSHSPGWVNGKLLDRMAEAVMAADGYNPAKWSYYLGLWYNGGTTYEPNGGGWNTSSIAASRHADIAGTADYNGGWDSGLTEALSADDPQAMFYTLANSNVPTKSGNLRGERFSALADMMAVASTGRAKPIRLVNYESGPGYSLNGLNGATVTAEQAASQELLMKSVASGTAVMDAFMTNAACGMISNNLFTLASGANWSARAKPHNGGAYYPHFQWFCFMNRHLIGRVRQIGLEVAQRLMDPAKVLRGQPVKLYEVAREDGSLAYVLCNIDPVNDHTVRVCKPLRGGTWTRYAMTGTARTTNLTKATKDDVQIVAEPMPAGFGNAGFAITLPAGKTEVYIETVA